MAHNLDFTTGKAGIAFLGSRNDVWHQHGQEMPAGASIEEWAKQAGLDWSALLARSYFDATALPGLSSDAVKMLGATASVDDIRHLVRSDTGSVLSTVSDTYQVVQPSDVLDWFKRYIEQDDRFHLDVAGSLKGGALIWATATFNGGMTVGGDSHVARLLMSTSFDQTQATINKGTMTRVVCNNTLDAALGDKTCLVRTSHRSKFDAKRVGNELANVARGFSHYQKMGDAMARTAFEGAEIAKLFKYVLDIPFETPKDDVSTRKMNQFRDLQTCYAQTSSETDKGTAWCALNAVTRYVDHEKSVRGAPYQAAENRFHAAQFGTGADMKAAAVSYLAPIVSENVNDAELLALLKQPFRATVN